MSVPSSRKLLCSGRAPLIEIFGVRPPTGSLPAVVTALTPGSSSANCWKERPLSGRSRICFSSTRYLPRIVKILDQPDNQRQAMMDGWYERQSLGSSVGVCNGAGEPGTAPPKRVLGGRESSSASALARTAAPVGSRAMHACGDRKATRAQSSGEGGLRGQTRHHLRLVPGGSSPASLMVPDPVAILAGPGFQPRWR